MHRCFYDLEIKYIPCDDEYDCSKLKGNTDLILLANNRTDATPKELTNLKEPVSLSFDITLLKGHKTIIDNIEKALVSNPPVNIKEGEFIKNGFDYNLDKHRMLRDQGKKVLAHLQQNLALKANISSLKIKRFYIILPRNYIEAPL